MGWIHDLAFRWRTLRGRRLREQELDDELRFHLEMEIEHRMAAGAERSEAERAARLAFGTPPAVKEACRDAWGARAAQELSRDLRSAARRIRQEPRYSAIVIASLALGIGAVALIFSMVDAVLLEPLPFGEPERLVAFRELTPAGEPFSTSDANLLDFRERIASLEDIAAISFPQPRPALLVDHERVRLSALVVTPSFFGVLGVEASLGRTFDPGPDGLGSEAPGARPRQAVLDHRAWERHFGAAPGVVGTEIDLDGELWTVIGVLPRGFRYGLSSPEVFLPYLPDPAFPRGDHRLDALARLAPGASLERARRETAAVAAQLSAEYPETNEDWSAELVPAREIFLGEVARRSQLVLLGAAGLLLLLSCVNVSSLMMARLGDRAREIQLRLALGASRGRIVKQLLTESAVLGVLGAIGGLAAAALAIPFVRRLEVPLPRLDEMGLEPGVVLGVAAVALTAGLGTGLAPALRLVGGTRAEHLRQRSLGSDPGGLRLRSFLVVGEIALAVMLAVGAGLLSQSFVELEAFDSGFETEGVLLAQLDLPGERYGTESREAGEFSHRLVERLEGLPAVEAAGVTIVDPFRGPRPSNQVSHAGERDRNAFLPVQWRSITPGYFRTLRIPLLRGRTPETRRAADGEWGPVEVVISSKVAERLWPGRDPVGQDLRWIGPDGPLFRVVGVAAEVQDLSLGDAPRPTVYLPQRRIGWPSMTVAVRTSGPFEPLAEAVREAVHELDPLLAPPAIATLEGRRREALAQPLLSLRSMGAFSALALMLAALGIYGIVAYSASRRRREFGLRKALGARPGQLAALVVRGSAGLVAAGIALGLLGSAAAAGSLRAILYETSPVDAGVLAQVAALLAALGLLAAWLPARRAARLDPLDALREE